MIFDYRILTFAKELIFLQSLRAFVPSLRTYFFVPISSHPVAGNLLTDGYCDVKGIMRSLLGSMGTIADEDGDPFGFLEGLQDDFDHDRQRSGQKQPDHPE